MVNLIYNSFSESSYQISKRLKIKATCIDYASHSMAEFVYRNNTVFIAADAQEQMYLKSIGVTTTRIIPYYMFCDTSYDHPLTGYERSKGYDAIFMGMSHSQCAIKVEKMPYTYLMMARPSCDLFCHLNYLRKAKFLLSEASNNIKQIILEVPYYIFNYDLSQFGDYVYTKLNYFKELGDFHNFKSHTAIEQFNLFMSYFNSPNGEIAKHKIHILKHIALALGLGHIIDLISIIKNNDSVWTKKYKKTIKENSVIFCDFVDFVKNNFHNAELIVVIMPFNPVFRLSHRNCCSKVKAEFYAIIRKYGIKIIDDFNIFNSPFLFKDHCHMNERGAEIYTRLLAEKLTAGKY